MMETQNPRLTKHLRVAGTLIILGLIVQLASLFWNHPLSFLLFVLVGSAILVAGILVYLFAIVSIPEKSIKDGITQSAELP
jgi:uncharacterized membrane protein